MKLIKKPIDIHSNISENMARNVCSLILLTMKKEPVTALPATRPTTPSIATVHTVMILKPYTLQ